MFSLVYVSSAVTIFTPQELIDLLKKCHENNTRTGLTGLLLYKDGNFMQALEGDKDSVMALYAKISRDPRHQGLLTIYDEDIAERNFPDWSMAFRDLNSIEVRSMEGFNEFMNFSFNPSDLALQPSICKSLLMTFKENM